MIQIKEALDIDSMFFIVSVVIDSRHSGIVLEHAQCRSLVEAQKFILETVAKEEDVPLDTIDAFAGGKNFHLDSCLLEIAQRFGDFVVYRYKISMEMRQTIIKP